MEEKQVWEDKEMMYRFANRKEYIMYIYTYIYILECFSTEKSTDNGEKHGGFY